MIIFKPGDPPNDLAADRIGLQFGKTRRSICFYLKIRRRHQPNEVYSRHNVYIERIHRLRRRIAPIAVIVYQVLASPSAT